MSVQQDVRLLFETNGDVKIEVLHLEQPVGKIILDQADAISTAKAILGWFRIGEPVDVT